MLVKTYASALQGVDAFTVTVEVNTGGQAPPNKPGYFLVGLPDNAVREGYKRIGAAITNIGKKMFRLYTVINLAPADIRKEGSSYDLPIAMAFLGATGQLISEKYNQYMMMGELSLDGGLRPIKGALPIAIQAKKESFRGLILPKSNAREAAIVEGLDVIGVSNLRQAVEFMEDSTLIKPTVVGSRENFLKQRAKYELDFADVRGQENVKRALEIAAAGGHNAVLIGPPGAGKTMLAKRMPGILPPLTLSEAMDTTKIHSVAGYMGEGATIISSRPFRFPHHTISDVAMVGGGSNPHPGEISLAHNGVLFLDELPEFKRSVLEVLRQPMEQRKVTISRARISVDYPASFMLIASMNPCPCGYYNHPEKECACSPGVVQRYLNRISGPLMDRIDLHVEVTPVSYEELSSHGRSAENSEDIRKRVIGAREIQERRFKKFTRISCNAHMPARMVREVCTIDREGTELLKRAMERLKMSARAYDRILKVARTCADLEGAEAIAMEHLSEAVNYRDLDREAWASQPA